MSALVFGLTLTNYQYLARKLGIERKVKIDKRRLWGFHEEITFLIKSFFFVFIGLIVSLSPKFMLYGILIVGLLAVIRYVAVTIVSTALKFSKVESTVTKLIFANGLPALVICPSCHPSTIPRGCSSLTPRSTRTSASPSSLELSSLELFWAPSWRRDS